MARPSTAQRREPMKTIHLRLPASLIDRANDVARREEVTPSAVLRRTIRRALAEPIEGATP